MPEAIVLFYVVATLLNGATAELGPFKTEEACNTAMRSPMVQHFGAKTVKIECIKRVNL